MKWRRVLLILGSTCHAAATGNSSKEQLGKLLGDASWSADFAARVGIEVTKANPSAAELVFLRSFLVDLYTACPKESPEELYYLLAEDISVLQETCLILMRKAISVGWLLTRTSLRDFHSTESMILAVRRVLLNARRGSEILKLTLQVLAEEKYATKCEDFVAESELYLHGKRKDSLKYPDVAHRFYGAVMTAVRLYERLIALMLLENERGDDTPRRTRQSLRSASRDGRSAVSVPVGNVEEECPIRHVKADLDEVIEHPENYYHFRRRLKLLKRNIGGGPLKTVFKVDRPTVRAELEDKLTMHEFFHAFAPWATISVEVEGASRELLSLNMKLARQYLKYRERIQKMSGEDEILFAQIKAADEITRTINNYVDRRCLGECGEKKDASRSAGRENSQTGSRSTGRSRVALNW